MHTKPELCKSVNFSSLFHSSSSLGAWSFTVHFLNYYYLLDAKPKLGYEILPKGPRKTNLYNRSHFHQMARMKKRVHKANEDESQSSIEKVVAPVAVATPVKEALMASEERRSTLHMPLWVQSVGEKIIQETLLQHFELIKEYAKLDPSKLWRVNRYWQADYKYFSKQNVSHVGTLLIPNHETHQQLFPRLAWSVCPSVTWQFYVLIHRQNRPGM